MPARHHARVWLGGYAVIIISYFGRSENNPDMVELVRATTSFEGHDNTSTHPATILAWDRVHVAWKDWGPIHGAGFGITFWAGLHKGANRETARGKKRTPSVVLYQGLLVITANQKQKGSKICKSILRGYHPSWHELSKIHDPLLRTGVLDTRRAQEAQHQL